MGEHAIRVKRERVNVIDATVAFLIDRPPAHANVALAFRFALRYCPVFGASFEVVDEIGKRCVISFEQFEGRAGKP